VLRYSLRPYLFIYGLCNDITEAMHPEEYPGFTPVSPRKCQNIMTDVTTAPFHILPSLSYCFRYYSQIYLWRS